MTRKQEILHASKQHKNALFDDYGDAFIAGAKWADEHPKNPWISVKDGLPCNHTEMLDPTCNIKTQYVITSIDGLCYINKMVKYRDKWIWEMDNPTHWMPIPKLPKELDYVRD